MNQYWFVPKYPGEKALQSVAAAVALAGTLLSMWALIGPYRWIVQLQVALFGGYRVTPTVLLTFLLLWLPPVLIMRVFLRRRARTARDIPAHFSSPETRILSASVAKCASWLYRRVLCTFPGHMVLVGAGLVGTSLFLHQRVASMGHLCEIDVGQLETGMEPDSSWLAVSGLPLLDAAVGIHEHTTFFYFPIVSQEIPSNGVAVYAKLHEREMLQGLLERTRRWEGVVETKAVPALVRLQHEKIGLYPAHNYRVLRIGRTPGKVRDTAEGVLLIGAIIAAIGVVLLTFTIYRTRNQS